jgi:hypothetical protein
MNMPSSGAPTQTGSNRATTALILGIVGIVCCQLCAPIAWWMGKQELEAVRAGLSPAANEGMAKAGKILGIVGTVWFGLILLWFVFFGGMAILSAFARGAHS